MALVCLGIQKQGKGKEKQYPHQGPDSSQGEKPYGQDAYS